MLKNKTHIALTAYTYPLCKNNPRIPITTRLGKFTITVTVSDFLILVGAEPLAVTLIIVVPGFTAVTTPADVTVATLGLEDDHTTVFIVAFAGRMVAARVVRAEIARRNGAVLFKRTLVT